MKPRKLPEDDAWSRGVASSFLNWASDWAKRKTKLALREGGKCGFCGYSPDRQTQDIRGKRLRQLTKRELLHRHMKDHLREAREYPNYKGDRIWKHPPGFDHRGQIKPKGDKP
jgi:hypothetical protein